MRLLTLVSLLLALMGSLYAAADTKDIIVGAFSTPKQAQYRNLKLEAYLGHDPVVSKLLKQKHFYFDVKYANGMYRSVLTHFVNSDESLTVLGSVKRIFPDAYMLPTSESGIPPMNVARSENTRPSKPASVASPKPKPAPSMTVAPLASVEPAPKVIPAEPKDDDVVIIDETQVKDETPTAQTAEDTDEVIAPVQEETATEALPVPEPQRTVSGTPWLLYAIPAAVVVLALLFFLARRKKPRGRVLKTPEMINLEPKEKTAPKAAEPAPQATPESEAPKASTKEAVSEAVPEVEAPPVEPAAPETPAPSPAVSPRKKRNLPPNLEGITKENLREFAGSRILVAEDNMINQKVITKLFEGSGIELDIANNGQEAIDMLTADPTYNMVLMDAHMPVKDGFEATREIRRNILFEPIAVVALSGDVSSDDIRKMREAGMEEQLAKPIRVDELYKVLYQYLDFDGANEEAEEELPELRPHGTDVPLNSEEGLEVCGGDMAMYIEILDEFTQTYGSANTLVDAYLRTNDDGKLVALMLDIKGVAANIGADPLSEAAETLREAVLINQTEVYEKLAKEFDEELSKTLAAIDSFKSTHLQ